MKRKTCFKYCKAIHEKLNEINGVLETPGYDRDAILFKKIYVVGSYVKGKTEPNDLDILIFTEDKGRGITLTEGGILDKEYKRRYGISRVKLAESQAYMWLTRGMKKVHRLNGNIDTTKFDVMVEIYPDFLVEGE